MKSLSVASHFELSSAVVSQVMSLVRSLLSLLYLSHASNKRKKKKKNDVLEGETVVGSGFFRLPQLSSALVSASDVRRGHVWLRGVEGCCEVVFLRECVSHLVTCVLRGANETAWACLM